jgi:hypothetical protein
MAQLPASDQECALASVSHGRGAYPRLPLHQPGGLSVRPHYVDVTAADTPALRMHYLGEGPRDRRRTRRPAARLADVELPVSHDDPALG